MADWTAKLQLPRGSLRQPRALARAACAAALGLTAALAMPPSSAAQRPPPPRAFQAPRDCFLPIDTTNALTLDARYTAQLQGIARDCRNAAEQRPQRGLVFAYFFAGWANGVLGAGQLAPPPTGLSIDSPDTVNVRQLQDAVVLLDISARMASISGADQATLMVQRRARLELARAHRLLGVGLRDQDHFDQADRELTSLSRDGAGDLQTSIGYERAMLVLDKPRQEGDNEDAELQAALQNLSPFTNIDPSPSRDQYIVVRGPTQLARLAVEMGDRAQTRQPQTFENAQLALTNFRNAVSAYEVLSQLGGPVDPLQASGTRVRMGLIDLRMAAVLAHQDSIYGCASGADSFSISEAENNFREALRLDSQSPDAQWGLGCALMARNNPSAAVDPFRIAVRNLGARGERALPRSEYYLGLARALSAVGQWDGRDGAIANFEQAVGSERDAVRQAGIYIEIADIYDDQNRWVDARLNLQRSIAAHASARAYLALGELLYEHPGLDAGDGAARENLTQAARINGPHQARANFVLSKVEQRVRRGPQAVDFATQAVRLENSNAEYRQQACLTRIIFRRTHDAGGQAYCTANAAADPSNPDAYPTALFYEGLFWLREAYLTSGGNQRNNWAQAILAFERGIVASEGRVVLFNDHDNRDDRINLTRLMTYGRRFALYCAGLGAAVPAQRGDVESDRERTDFKQLYDLDRCWGS